jgi:hypothetical protein
MKLLLSLLVLLSANSYALDYERILFSNGTQPLDPQELLKKVRMQMNDLYGYDCNQGRDQLFTDDLNMNPASNSLLIKDGNDKVVIYIDKKLYTTDGKPTRAKGSWIKRVYTAMLRLEKIPVAATLIDKLETSFQPVVIKKGGNQFDPSYDGERRYTYGNNASFVMNFDERKPFVDGIPFNLIGSGGRIFWNPDMKSKFVESDGVKRSIDGVVALAHEMYHAYDSIRGLLDRRFVKGDGLEFSGIHEYRAVFLENMVRKGLGRKYRKLYGQTDSENDLLDENGEPIWITDPCIGWL